jgi:hypothetical protein
MTMADFAVFFSTQFTLLVSFFAIKIYVRQTDVLSGRYFHKDGDQLSNWDEHLASPERNRAGRRPQAQAPPFLRARPRHRSTTAQETSPQAPDQTEAGKVQTVGAQILVAPAALAPGVRIYAIGDIHGRADLLRAILEKVDIDRTQRPVNRPIILFIGDYVDRGPSSREVLDILIKYREMSESIFLKGNHETFISRFLKEPAALNEWRLCGGLETLLSYGLKPSFNPDERERRKLSEEFAGTIAGDHLAFLNSLQLSFRCGDFLFVHAGIRPGVPLADQAEEDLLWIREDFLGSKAPFGVFVVHGHTPVGAPEMRSNRLNIDTGAFATGRLTCAVIEGSAIMALTADSADFQP